MTRQPASSGGAITALFTVIVGLLLFLLADLVKERVAASARLQVAPARVEIHTETAGVGRSLAQLDLSGRRALRRGRSILDPRLPDIVTRNVERHPWVRRVTEVHRRFPNGLRVDVELRRPVGVYKVSTERLAVDQDGVVIESASPLRPPYVPWIRTPGQRPTYVPRTGRAFGGASAVVEAISVLDDLAAEGGHAALESMRVDEIHVGARGRERRPGDPDIRLVLDSGVHVLWGRSPRSALAVMENDAATKLNLLEDVLRAFPGLLNVRAVDLRFGRPEVTMKPGARAHVGG